jgi:hypothetical protein
MICDSTQLPPPYLKALSDWVPLIATATAVFEEYHLDTRQIRHLVLLCCLVTRSETDLAVGVSQCPLMAGLKDKQK